jgi:glycosyltransferase involved in cell wall biosynthesis
MLAPVRILYAENDRGAIGGSIRALYQLVKYLDREHYQPYVALAREKPSPMLSEFEDLGCEIVLARGPRPASRGSSRLGQLRHEITRARELARVIRLCRIDLVHANNNMHSSRYAILAAAWCRIPVVCHQRGQFTSSLGTRLASRLVRESLCVSRAIYETLEKRGARPVGARIVYDGVEVPETRPPSRPLGADARIAVLGRLTEWKGQQVLVEAAPRVLARFPAARFVIVGDPDGSEGARYRERIRERIARLGLGDHVKFVGHVRDVVTFLRERVDVVVHTSIQPEPFGLVVAEGMAAGKPVVASDAGGCPEIVEDGRSGLLYPPGNAEALAERLARLLSDPEWAESLAANGWDRVRERFDARRTAVEVTATYREILAV